MDQLFERKEVVLNDKSRRILKLLDEALKSQSINASKFFTAVTEDALSSRKYELPAVYVEGRMPTFEPMYEKYAFKINFALESVGKGSKETSAVELKSRFTIVREILLRLVVLICSRDAMSEKWLGVYIVFAEKINQTDLLVNRHGLFNRGRVSQLNLMLCDQEIKDELTGLAKHLDMLYVDVTKISSDERKKVEEYRNVVSFKAVGELCRLAQDPILEDVLPGFRNLAYGTN